MHQRQQVIGIDPATAQQVPRLRHHGLTGDQRLDQSGHLVTRPGVVRVAAVQIGHQRSGIRDDRRVHFAKSSR